MSAKYQRIANDPQELSKLSTLCQQFGMTRALVTIFGTEAWEGIRAAWADGSIQRLFPYEVDTIRSNLNDLKRYGQEKIQKFSQSHPKISNMVSTKIAPRVKSTFGTVRQGVNNLIYGNNPINMIPQYSGRMSELSQLNPFNVNNLIGTMPYFSSTPPSPIGNFIASLPPDLGILIMYAKEAFKAYGKRVWALYKDGTLQKTDPKAYSGITYLLNFMNRRTA